jgi:hypothetical protein
MTPQSYFKGTAFATIRALGAWEPGMERTIGGFKCAAHAVTLDPLQRRFWKPVLVLAGPQQPPSQTHPLGLAEPRPAALDIPGSRPGGPVAPTPSSTRAPRPSSSRRFHHPAALCGATLRSDGALLT